MLKQLEIRTRRPCSQCGGTGVTDSDETKRCIFCDGNRYTEKWITFDEFIELADHVLGKRLVDHKVRHAELLKMLQKAYGNEQVSGQPE